MAGCGAVSSTCALMKHRCVTIPGRLTGQGPVFTSGLNIQGKQQVAFVSWAGAFEGSGGARRKVENKGGAVRLYAQAGSVSRREGHTVRTTK